MKVTRLRTGAIGLTLQLLPISWVGAALFSTVHAKEPSSMVSVDAPFMVQARFTEAQELVKQKKWAEAVVVLRSVTSEAPGFIPAQIDLARALTFSGRREEALSLLGQAIDQESFGKHREGLKRKLRVISRTFTTSAHLQSYQEGLNQLQQHHYQQARKAFLDLAVREPSNVEVLLRLGQSWLLEGDADSAAERLRHAKRLNPYEPEIRLWLGRALHLRGELSEALKELVFAENELEKSELAPLWLSDALIAVGRNSQAHRLLEKDVNKEPLHILSLVKLAKLQMAQIEDSAKAREKHQGGLGLQERERKETSPASDVERSRFWGVRKHLQVALSRFGEYESKRPLFFEGELGVELRKPEQLKKEIEFLIQRVEGRLESSSNSAST